MLSDHTESRRYRFHEMCAHKKSKFVLEAISIEQAVERLKPEADAGNVDAALMLVHMYLFSRGVPKDLQKAAHWAKVAARADPDYTVDELLKMSAAQADRAAAALESTLSILGAVDYLDGAEKDEIERLISQIAERLRRNVA